LAECIPSALERAGVELAIDFHDVSVTVVKVPKNATNKVP